MARACAGTRDVGLGGLVLFLAQRLRRELRPSARRGARRRGRGSSLDGPLEPARVQVIGHQRRDVRRHVHRRGARDLVGATSGSPLRSASSSLRTSMSTVYLRCRSIERRRHDRLATPSHESARPSRSLGLAAEDARAGRRRRSRDTPRPTACAGRRSSARASCQLRRVRDAPRRRARYDRRASCAPRSSARRRTPASRAPSSRDSVRATPPGGVASQTAKVSAKSSSGMRLRVPVRQMAHEALAVRARAVDVGLVLGVRAAEDCAPARRATRSGRRDRARGRTRGAGAARSLGRPALDLHHLCSSSALSRGCAR